MVNLRLRTSLLVSLLLLCSLALFAQGRKLNVTADPDATAPAQMGDHDADAGGDHPLEREQWFRSGRTVLGGPAAEQLLRAFHQKQAMQQAEQGAAQISGTDATGTQSGSANLQTGFANLSQTTGGAWKSLGPSPMLSDAELGGSSPGFQDYGFVSGRMTSVAVDQTNPSTVYVGAAFGGLWKTTNATAPAGSVIWTQMLDAQPTLAVGAVAVNGSTVLVGTGEGNSSGDSYYGMGILRSTDGGSTWTLVKGADCTDPTNNVGCTTSFVGMAATAIAFGNNGTVVASFAGSGEGSRRNAELSTSRRGLYYSADSGASWHRAQVPDPVRGIPITNQSFSATAVVFNKFAGPPDSITGMRPGAFFAVIRSEGYYTSPDGQNWNRLADGSQPNGLLGNIPSGCNTSNSCQIYRGQIAVNPSNGDMYTIYVSTSGGKDGGVYKTDPTAGSWQALGSTGIEDPNSGNVIGQGAYNLWIGAVPVTGGTEVLVGAVNMFKCKLTNGATTCDGNINGGWLNLTHAYDCKPAGAPAHVHPDQHAFDFNVSAPTQMYFVNDGGVYRSLTGANGDGTCTSANPFDNLNQTMGSVSEFVGISQHPTNPGVILGGLQDNGSPLLAPASVVGGVSIVPPLWRSVNGGDGGVNAIDPNAPDSIYYTSNFGVSIQQCTSGLGCHQFIFGDPASNFVNNNIDAPQVSSDKSEFYPPYILDPANTQNVILGTCRVWRGPGVGGSTWSISNNISQKFDANAGNSNQGNTAACSSHTTITALAAGGPVAQANVSGQTVNVSTVIYAGLEGVGTGGSFGQSGNIPGHIFVTTNADSATPNWVDVSGNINPLSPNQAIGIGPPFPISSITIDKSVPSGATAYVTIQGFNGGTGGHIFKTTNFGSSWIDISAGLPDAPANSLAIDPDNASTIYVGTDIGAFVTSNGGSTWQNLGSALPNVPVTTLLVYKNGTDKRLRASTYGRGVWELTLVNADFTVTLAPTTVNVLRGQSASITGTLTAIGTYASSVALSCISGSTAPPTTCGTTSATPTGTGQQFSIPVGSQTAGTYSFSIRAVGSDGAATVHSVPVTVNVQDFNVSPAQGTLNVTAGQVSPSLTVAVQPIAGYSGAVSLSCSQLPANAYCVISPQSTIPGLAGPVNTRVAIVTNTGTPQGLANVTLTATSGTLPAKTVSIALTVSGTVTLKRAKSLPRDFDGDGRTDLAIFTPATGNWKTRSIYGNQDGGRQWGAPADVPVAGDFDGDGKADYAVWRPSNGTWYVVRSSDGVSISQQWGQAGDVPVTGDFDGDGKTDFAVFRPSSGTWFVIRSSDKQIISQQWGQAGDTPVPGDYDGDGKDDFAVFRPTTGFWFVIRSGDHQTISQQWGQGGDVPVPGDYDGDGKFDFTVYRPGNGTWYSIRSSDRVVASQQFGAAGDIPVTGDFDGDGKYDFATFRPGDGTYNVMFTSGNSSIGPVYGSGGDLPGIPVFLLLHRHHNSQVNIDGDLKTDVSVFRPSINTWFTQLSGAPGASTSQVLGQTGDVLVPGDYDGDNKTDYAVWRPATGQWIVLQSSTGAQVTQQWGSQGDIPVPGDYDGDGKNDYAVWRPSNGTWYIILSGSGRVVSQQWGAQGDIVAAADFDGDGKTDFAVWRPNVGTWFILLSGSGRTISQQWGAQGDYPVASDYDGDGVADIAVWRPTDGNWYILQSGSHLPFVQQWGQQGDIPVPGDYDGDGKTDVAVWRQSSGFWYAFSSANPGFIIQTQWGASTDVPLNAKGNQ